MIMLWTSLPYVCFCYMVKYTNNCVLEYNHITSSDLQIWSTINCVNFLDINLDLVDLGSDRFKTFRKLHEKLCSGLLGNINLLFRCVLDHLRLVLFVTSFRNYRVTNLCKMRAKGLIYSIGVDNWWCVDG